MGKEKQMRGLPKGPNNISSMKRIIVNGKHYKSCSIVMIPWSLFSFFVNI